MAGKIGLNIVFIKKNDSREKSFLLEKKIRRIK
nr:MAG TPA: hypothetical protein [Caudoviricetes sp.]